MSLLTRGVHYNHHVVRIPPIYHFHLTTILNTWKTPCDKHLVNTSLIYEFPFNVVGQRWLRISTITNYKTSGRLSTTGEWVETIYRQFHPSRDCHTPPTLPSIVLPQLSCTANPSISCHARPTLPHLSYTATLPSIVIDSSVTDPILGEHRTSCNRDFQRHVAPRYGFFQRGSKPAVS